MGLTRPKITQMEKLEKMKDKHFWASMIQSIMRIGACYLLFTGNIQMGAAGLALAEVVGIVEEMV